MTYVPAIGLGLMTSRVSRPLYFKSVASTHARVRRLAFKFILGLELRIHKKYLRGHTPLGGKRVCLCLSSPIDCPSVVFRVVCLSPQTDYLPVSPDRPFVGCVDRLLVTLDRLSVRLPRSTVSQLSSSSICPFRPFVCQSSRPSVLVTVRLSSRSLL